MERDLASSFVTHSVTAGTMTDGRRALELWTSYLDSLPPENRPMTFMENVTKGEEQEIRLTLFVQHLYKGCGLRAEQLTAHMSALKREFELQLRDTTAFKGDLVSRAKAASKRSTTEARQRTDERAAVVKLPLPGGAVWPAREEFFTSQRWDATGMDRRVKWIALAISYDHGLRVSNVTLRDGPKAEDHCIRAEDVTFFCRREPGEALVAVAGGEPFRAYLGGDESRFREVEHCSLRFQSSKTISFTHTLARRSECEFAVLEDLCLWVARSGVRGKDELTTRYPPVGDHVHSRKVLTAKEYGSILAWVAVQAKLPVSSFSSKSARIGYATTGQLDGLSREEINEGGGWAKGSYTPARSYINRSVTRAKHPVE